MCMMCLSVQSYADSFVVACIAGTKNCPFLKGSFNTAVLGSLVLSGQMCDMY